MNRTTTIRVIIADPGQAGREELGSILSRADEIEVVGRPENAAQLLESLETDTADVVLVDLALRGLDAFAMADELSSSNGDGPRVLLMAQRNDSRYVARALHAGAAGYLLKDRAYEELVDALRRVASGGVYVSSGIAGIEREEPGR